MLFSALAGERCGAMPRERRKIELCWIRGCGLPLHHKGLCANQVLEAGAKRQRVATQCMLVPDHRITGLGGAKSYDQKPLEGASPQPALPPQAASEPSPQSARPQPQGNGRRGNSELPKVIEARDSVRGHAQGHAQGYAQGNARSYAQGNDQGNEQQPRPVGQPAGRPVGRPVGRPSGPLWDQPRRPKAPASQKSQKDLSVLPSSGNPPEKPPEQGKLPSGLYRYYDPLNLGVPLPDGLIDPSSMGVPAEAIAKEREWRFGLLEERMHTREHISSAAKRFMLLWTKHVEETPKSERVLERQMPNLVRRFTDTHALRLALEMRNPFIAHLCIMAEHNLLHKDDLQDCLLLLEARTAEARTAAEARAAAEPSAPANSAASSAPSSAPSAPANSAANSAPSFAPSDPRADKRCCDWQ